VKDWLWGPDCRLCASAGETHLAQQCLRRLDRLDAYTPTPAPTPANYGDQAVLVVFLILCSYVAYVFSHQRYPTPTPRLAVTYDSRSTYNAPEIDEILDLANYVPRRT
jgi:hypothetical protein